MLDYLETTIDKFIFKVAKDRLYTSEGIWAKIENSLVRIGVTDFFQQHNGDIAFATVQPAGTVVGVNDELASVETIKVTLALTSPISGKIVNINKLVTPKPEIINQDPYGSGWLCEIEAKRWEAESEKLLTPDQYFTKMKNDAEEEVNKG